MDKLVKQDNNTRQISRPLPSVGGELARIQNPRDCAEVSKLVPNSVAAIMDATPICVLKQTVDVSKIQMQIEYELTICSARMNVANNMRPDQIIFTAECILSQYPAESVEDIVLVLRRGSMGYYGTTYHQFDTAIVLQWIQLHIQEKCDHLERSVTDTKTEETKVDYEAFKKRLEEERIKNEKLKEMKRESRIKELERKTNPEAYVPPSYEDVVMKLMRIEWGKQMHDLYGKPIKNGYLTFEEWLKQ